MAASLSIPLLLPHLEEEEPPEGFFRGRGRCCCLRWERGASTLEERKPSRFSAYQREKFPFDISKVAPLPRQGFPVFVCTKTQLAILLLCAQKYNLLFSIFELREDLLKGL